MRLLTGAVRPAGAVVALDLLLCVVIVAVRGVIFCCAAGIENMRWISLITLVLISGGIACRGETRSCELHCSRGETSEEDSIHLGAYC